MHAGIALQRRTQLRIMNLRTLYHPRTDIQRNIASLFVYLRSVYCIYIAQNFIDRLFEKTMFGAGFPNFKIEA